MVRLLGSSLGDRRGQTRIKPSLFWLWRGLRFWWWCSSEFRIGQFKLMFVLLKLSRVVWWGLRLIGLRPR